MDVEKENVELPQTALLAELMSVLSEYLSQEQLDQVHQAYQVASEAHAGQYRLSGEDYICHPVSVALILSHMKMDVDCIMAAIMHDLLEDTDTTYEELASLFNDDVAGLVDAVSKLTKINFKTREEAQAENMRKMFLAMAKDLRVIIIKLADRLHNMRTIKVMKPASRRRIAKETLDIYAPIAHRLGMHEFRLELEDLSFEAMFPRRRAIINKSIKKARGNRKEVVDKVEKLLVEKFLDTDFPGVIYGREKNLYSVYRKMKRQNIPFNEVFDVYAFRVIVETIEQCYQALGLLHNLFKPVPGRFKDYIALPKTNGYQSLHTVLVGPFGVPIELQIRTLEMDRLAESGIAAHWLYKTTDVAHDAKVRAHEWLRNLLETQKGSDDSFEFIDTLKVDLFPTEIFVFSPKGKIVKLPKGSTAVDFAFAVHTDIGMACAGVKINRIMEPLHTVLRNGQTIEIMTSDFAVCNPNWLNFVVTNKARHAIRNHLKEFKERDAIRLGGQLLNAEFKSVGLNFDDVDPEQLQKFLSEQQIGSLDALLMDLGFGNRMPLLVAQHLIAAAGDEDSFIDIAKGKQATATLNIHGADGMLINLGTCCRPIPGDKIIGFFNPGRGVVVHRVHCKNTREYKRKHKNWLSVQWANIVEGEFSSDIGLELKNERGVLAEIASILSSYDCNIENIKIASRSADASSDVFTITVRDRKHLARVMRRLHALASVIKIARIRN
ncbi:MAG: RelA/SpoT family protein [Cycloclasticus pugetii]|jgi:RelA/SpoT family (p)ppGpp synthetase|uniref:guanosine-3',5'-bis(diphosphate) 3'-diphosphatase n=2 Tax=Cycloclasticus TaxID=34067 RepID=S5T5Y5_9GAMM|nr:MULTISPECIES: bifunctional (p)ppGpp synthetase/guanosine-3',5'-bis(diphosphate) 3'-pyrophosphohydrolase [Cycloclasticus]AFT67865.1 ppGpp synthetase I, SpoT/RelA [Cycloclasticus sp. P1]AGS38964.1 Guanosine-3',5'-bis(diphosphate) 3'-pyrophosphatase [Cycloclasticus zancles 78-ME]ATI02593.1 bifunctional (p)ppGpp synthetase/guanosine-3',5'-bis(diphosphate) 3'-pyrophosphohydrolase [Cycloclasticus sp. PY97N]EPD12769.1 ppGpp synthetase I, SpoT/RelA [Cycloclasticus pugetii]MBV1899121.1 bifunctional |tara:strand:+ start:4297 stop:6459 length:2163 start_codon:yes stop_codon:yes gene_type:complete